ncbi:altered inheritance of mitochondria protein 32-like [Lycium barbarum]|uniref:altered inheritance of mitochondria protein 32-like n=1 Tax=Lycium barbarum TaxID=112863 RepID=UPI00293F4290|nr:altered inheritance of mitochondria protein 32-like [Lycium barbarum]
MLFKHSLSSITFYLHFSSTKISQKPFTLLSARALTHSMATGTPENISTAADDGDDVKFGFKRSEMYESKLAGTATSYDRHLFLCYKSHDTWPPRVEASDTDLLPKLLSNALKARKDDIKIKTLLTVCEVRDDMEVSDGDILIFPEMIKYRDLKESDVDAFVDDVLVNGNPWSSGLQESLSGSYVFVCAHNNRDRRCGVCGPILIEEFSKAIESKGLKDKVHVTACSHIGGHKYAGNVIIFSSGKDGEIVGHWYGYVTPNDVPVLLDEHIGEGKVIERLWRGQMGQYEKVTDKVDEQKVPEVTNEEKKPLENGTQESNVTGFSCCQGDAGVSCCRDASAEQKESKKGQGRVSNWFGKWEQREVLTAVGVVGAVAVVAVAYGFYKKSR